MKKDRDCNYGSPYPVYPAYQGMPYMQNMPMMGPSPFNFSNQNSMMNSSMMNSSMNTTDQTFNNLLEQINLLDKRVTNLESMMNSNNMSNQYSSSNYQMM